MIKIDGMLIDMPKAERGFQRFTSEMRANRAASFRLGYRQRTQIGEAYWTHPYCPDVCFPTKNAAYRAALQSMSAAPLRSKVG